MKDESSIYYNFYVYSDWTNNLFCTDRDHVELLAFILDQTQSLALPVPVPGQTLSFYIGPDQ